MRRVLLPVPAAHRAVRLSQVQHPSLAATRRAPLAASPGRRPCLAAQAGRALAAVIWRVPRVETRAVAPPRRAAARVQRAVAQARRAAVRARPAVARARLVRAGALAVP